jgi:hypothetical protein
MTSAGSDIAVNEHGADWPEIVDWIWASEDFLRGACARSAKSTSGAFLRSAPSASSGSKTDGHN